MVYKAEPAAPEPVLREEIVIDYVGLQRELGLNRDITKLGYTEKAFQTCGAGYGYSASQDCRQDYFVVVHFQLLCRDSEGTISTPLGVEDMRPLSRRSVTWNLAGTSAEMQLDNEGFGQFRTTYHSSPRQQRLKITADNDFLYLRAGEINRVVAPGNWCN